MRLNTERSTTSRPRDLEPLGDAARPADQLALGRRTPQTRSSTKGATGHCLEPQVAVEAIFATLA